MWYKIKNESVVNTPALLIFPDRIKENIRRMIQIAGNVSRLRPHVKTHKMAEVIKLQIEQNITKFKCATLAEVEMVARNGGEDILLAYPLVGPSVSRFFDLIKKYPAIRFSVTVDNTKACTELSQKAAAQNQITNVFIDIDNGMHRTGVDPVSALDIVKQIDNEKFLRFSGLHIYDGHIHITDYNERKIRCDKDFESIEKLVSILKERGIEDLELSCGGTFSFPIHAKHSSRTLCPGTPLLWDYGYKNAIPDLDFLNAAVLAGRVISKPGKNFCLDLGHKSMAAEMTQPRVHFLDFNIESIENQSEEHLVVTAKDNLNPELGEMVYTLPKHICPTVALHEKVYIVKGGKVVNTWNVAARKRYY